MIRSHQGWDWSNPPPRGGGRHAEEIDNLWRAYANCQRLYERRCREPQNCPPTSNNAGDSNASRDAAAATTALGILLTIITLGAAGS